MVNNQKGFHLNRRGFIKTTALAGMAATLPTSSFAEKSIVSGSKPSPAGKKRNLLFLTDVPENFVNLIESIKSIKEYEINVITIKTDFQNHQELLKAIQEKNADIILMRLSANVTMSSRFIAEGMGTLDLPVILLPVNYDLIMWETDLAASFRIKGTNAIVANSEDHALELIKIVAAPRPLEGQKAMVFGKPFNSTSIPAPNLNVDYVYKLTGVRIEHRPIDDLKQLLKDVDMAAARKELEKWKNGAKKVIGPTDEMMLHCAKMNVLLHSLIEKENLAAVSIDCLSFSFGSDTTIPLPCLAYTELRDEGITAACEADIYMMLSSMLMQSVSGRPSFQSNVSSVDVEKSTAILRHCVTPTKIYGSNAPQIPYNLRDYHGMGKGVVPEIEYPVGLDITMGGFTKDLKSFLIWPGRIVKGIDDTGTPSFIQNAPPGYENWRKYCSNRAEIKVKDVHDFMKKIVGIHHNMIAGSYGKAIADSLIRMNINVIAPPDLAAPEA
ncbi:MAG: hypothetical protein JW787_07915 [Sedimentisphaerales bacterium]|nr:hypothetical protein [Sedimentisphaerales bacterium]